MQATLGTRKDRTMTIKIGKFGPHGLEFKTVNAPGQLHEALEELLCENSGGLETADLNQLKQALFNEAKNDIEDQFMKHFGDAPEGAVNRALEELDRKARAAGFEEDELNEMKALADRLARKCADRRIKANGQKTLEEKTEEAFFPKFTEGEAHQHMAEIAALQPGKQFEMFRKDLSISTGYFLAFATAPGTPDGIFFLNYVDGHIRQGIAPYPCIKTAVTAHKVEQLKSWRENKPDFVEE
jgi:hypothetical protein